MLVILSKDAQKQYEHLPKIEQVKVYKKLRFLEVYPTAGKKLAGELSGIRSIRVWPYRIIYEINGTKKRVEILKIAHRQGVYR
ncbi:type II toxin-antitoxin system RelE/ParE family toxin [Candidatus Roizmanbacteria bacterium]|nr:type II toxin-antitoxin system RelE/ParE family toxin [Candidatus Roizmanbacteria bacterium]